MILRRSLTACSGTDLGPFLESSFGTKINLNLANALVYGRLVAKIRTVIFGRKIVSTALDYWQFRTKILTVVNFG